MKKNKFAKIVNIPGVGGFPVRNINYWKVRQPLLETGNTSLMLTVVFKDGGLMDIPGHTPEQFASLIYGIPY